MADKLNKPVVPVASPEGPQDFYSEIMKRINEPAFAQKMASVIFNQAMDGEAGALKFVRELIERERAQHEDLITLTDEQYENIILLAAARIARLRAAVSA